MGTNANFNSAVTAHETRGTGDMRYNEREVREIVVLARSQGVTPLLSGHDLSFLGLYEADLSGSDMHGSDLGGANLGGANLSHVDLSDADLSNVDLAMANLEGANLSQAHLFAANLRGANLKGANLQGAGLNGANLSEAIFEDTDLSGTTYDSYTRWPIGFDRAGAGAVRQL